MTDHAQPTIAPGIDLERSPVTAAELSDLGVDLARDFPGASADEFKRYPIYTDGGWFIVVKHQPTLTTVFKEPWRLLGPIVLTSEGLVID